MHTTQYQVVLGGLCGATQLHNAYGTQVVQLTRLVRRFYRHDQTFSRVAF